ncbi:hypothetical protein PG990_014122 [Apiospora arundinis]
MKMLIQILALMGLLMGAAANFTAYADPGQCEVIQQWHVYSVIADCPKPDGTWQCSIIAGKDLDNCYANYNVANISTITPQEDGKYSATCNACYWENTEMYCYCSLWVDGVYEFMQSKIDTNDLLVNANGFMKCFDRVASKCPQGIAPTGYVPPEVVTVTANVTATAIVMATASSEARLEKNGFQA